MLEPILYRETDLIWPSCFGNIAVYVAERDVLKIEKQRSRIGTIQPRSFVLDAEIYSLKSAATMVANKSTLIHKLEQNVFDQPVCGGPGVHTKLPTFLGISRSFLTLCARGTCSTGLSYSQIGRGSWSVEFHGAREICREIV